MAYYQIQKEQLVDTIGGYEDMQSEGSYKGAEEIREFKQELYDLENAVFVSTGGNPSIHQFKGSLQRPIMPSIISALTETLPAEPLPSISL